jgi:hypothetical protein
VDKMDHPQHVILTPFNYHEWNSKEMILLSNGLYRITMGTEIEPNSAVEKEKWFNGMDEAFGLLFLSIYPNLLFHIESAVLLSSLILSHGSSLSLDLIGEIFFMI